MFYSAFFPRLDLVSLISGLVLILCCRYCCFASFFSIAQIHFSLFVLPDFLFSFIRYSEHSFLRPWFCFFSNHSFSYSFFLFSSFSHLYFVHFFLCLWFSLFSNLSFSYSFVPLFSCFVFCLIYLDSFSSFMI